MLHYGGKSCNNSNYKYITQWWYCSKKIFQSGASFKNDQPVLKKEKEHQNNYKNEWIKPKKKRKLGKKLK